MKNRVFIYRAAEAFLYLPTYVASYSDIFRTMDSRLDVDFETPGGSSGSDITAITTMISNARENPTDVHIALCDPSVIFCSAAKVQDPEENIRLIGAVISKPPFWGANSTDGEIAEDELPKNFDQLLYYGPQLLTGYYIGVSLSDRQKLQGIPLNDFFGAIPALRSIYQMPKRKRTLAITADIISLAHVCTNGEFNLNHRFSKNKNYKNLITAGLITTASACINHSDQLVKVLEGIQRAMLVLRSSKKIAFDVCAHLVTERKVDNPLQSPLNEEEITWIVDQIQREDFYPADLSVSEDQWITAIQARKGVEMWGDDLRLPKALKAYERIVVNDLTKLSRVKIAVEVGFDSKEISPKSSYKLLAEWLILRNIPFPFKLTILAILFGLLTRISPPFQLTSWLSLRMLLSFCILGFMLLVVITNRSVRAFWRRYARRWMTTAFVFLMIPPTLTFCISLYLYLVKHDQKAEGWLQNSFYFLLAWVLPLLKKSGTKEHS